MKNYVLWLFCDTLADIYSYYTSSFISTVQKKNHETITFVTMLLNKGQKCSFLLLQTRTMFHIRTTNITYCAMCIQYIYFYVCTTVCPVTSNRKISTSVLLCVTIYNTRTSYTVTGQYACTRYICVSRLYNDNMYVITFFF